MCVSSVSVCFVSFVPSLSDGPCLVSAYVLCTCVLVFIGKDIPGLILLIHKHSVVCCIKPPAIYAYSKI